MSSARTLQCSQSRASNSQSRSLGKINKATIITVVRVDRAVSGTPVYTHLVGNVFQVATDRVLVECVHVHSSRSNRGSCKIHLVYIS